MKSIKEIEERIGFSLEYNEWNEYVGPNDWNNFTHDVVEHRELNQRSKEAVEHLLVESLNTGDMETASLCEKILEEASLDKEEVEELRSAEDERVAQILADIDSLDENASIEDIEELLENIKLSKSACRRIDDETKNRIEDKRQRLDTILQQKVKDKISSLDEQIAELQEHIEIPENEDKINELQQQIESLEEKYYEDDVRDSHKAKRIAEQGIDMSEIMTSISEYKIYGVKNLDENNFNILNAQVAKKTQYLEQKLAFLQKYKDIPGNAERIAEIESQIETMQDSWIVAQKGYNNMDGILQTAESRKNEIQNRLLSAQQEMETIDPMSRAYLQKRSEIENLTKEVARYERYIERMQQTKEEIESGESLSFMGEHHRNRLQREEQERVETKRGQIQDLEGQIAELQEHIEIPENEQKIIDLQAQIDEIEATIPSDRGNHKRARLKEQGRDTETILADIDDIVERFNDPYIEGTAKSIDTEIKTRVAYLENKMNYLQQHLDIAGNKERVAELQSQIEQLEDKWELCTQGFGSKEQLDGRIRITKAHLYTTLMSFKGNKDLKLSPEQMQEYWDKMQNGEEVPELVGQHHRERFEREQEAREAQARAEQEAKAKAEAEAREAQARAEEEAKAKAEAEAREAQARAEKEAKAKAEAEAREAQARAEQEAKVKAEAEAREAQARAEQEAQEKARKEEVDRQLREHEEYMASVEPQIKARVDRTMEEYWQSWGSSEVTTSKQYEEQQPEKIRPREKSLKDEVGDEFRTTEQQMQKQDNPAVDLWMNRFSGWYGAIDRVSQSVKNKFVKMKSDIIKAISEKLKDRTNNRQTYTQEQDANER